MTEHDDKQMARVDAVANVEPSKERRRLVKGAMLATPAVMTLMNGRLASAVSLTCPEKPVAPQPGWTDQAGRELIIENGQLGYMDNTQDPPVFMPYQSGSEQTAFHSATCWDSAYPSQG